MVINLKLEGNLVDWLDLGIFVFLYLFSILSFLRRGIEGKIEFRVHFKN